MGFLSSVLKKAGIIKDKKTYLPEKTNSALEMAKKQKDEFDRALAFQPAAEENQTFMAEFDTERKVMEVEEDKIKVRVFSFAAKDQREDKAKIKYQVESVNPDGSGSVIGIVKELPTREELINLSKQTTLVINEIKDAVNGGIKSNRIQSDLQKKMQDLSKKYRMEFASNVINMVKNMGEQQNNSGVDYRGIERRLYKRIDFSGLDESEIFEIRKNDK